MYWAKGAEFQRFVQGLSQHTKSWIFCSRMIKISSKKSSCILTFPVTSLRAVSHSSFLINTLTRSLKRTTRANTCTQNSTSLHTRELTYYYSVKQMLPEHIMSQYVIFP